MIQLRELHAQRANRAAVTFYFGPVHDQNVNKVPDAIRGLLPFDFPLLQHLPGIRQTHIDHGIQNFVLGFEVIVKIAARDLYDIRNVRERGMLVILEQIVDAADHIGSINVEHIGNLPSSGPREDDDDLRAILGRAIAGGEARCSRQAGLLMSALPPKDAMRPKVGGLDV
jgi:hypothetical protein